MDIPTILRQRDRASFDWLYSRYAGMLFGLIRRMVNDNSSAEILLQETFVEAWKTLDEDGKGRDPFIRMLWIARAKADRYTKAGANPAAEKNKLPFWTGSSQQQQTGQKHYSN